MQEARPLHCLDKIMYLDILPDPRLPAEVASMRRCAKFDSCSAPICPLEAAEHRVMLPGEHGCSGMVPAKEAPQAPFVFPRAARFIVIYTPQYLGNAEPVAVFDLKKMVFKPNLLGLGVGGTLHADIGYHECYGYVSPVADLAKLPRNPRGDIEAKARPVRLTTEELQAALAAALTPRGRKAGEPPRPLRGGLTAGNRHQRPKLISDRMLQRAAELRAEGTPWRIVANAVGVNFEALKTAFRRAGGSVA